MTKAQKLLKSAEGIAKHVDAWGDLTNALFSPQHGLLTRAYPSKAERAEFMKTAEFRRIQELVWEARERTGLVEGATPRKSGKFVVRLPESLHAALEREARAEGVSLNQLVVAKLAVQLKVATKRKRQAS